MIPSSDRAIEALKRITLGKRDDDVCLVEAGVLLICLLEMEDHAHCEEELDDLRGDLSTEHKEELKEIEDELESARSAIRNFLRLYDRSDSESVIEAEDVRVAVGDLRPLV